MVPKETHARAHTHTHTHTRTRTHTHTHIHTGPDTARLDYLTVATSVVAFRSSDNGSSWEYTATLCNASDHRGCGECCNENHVVTLADGHTVMAVYRMGAGDGTQFNKSLGINGSCALPAFSVKHLSTLL